MRAWPSFVFPVFGASLLALLACSGRTISDPPGTGGFGNQVGGPGGSGNVGASNPQNGGGPSGGGMPQGGGGGAGVGNVAGVPPGGSGGIPIGGSGGFPTGGVGADPSTGGAQISCGTMASQPNGTVTGAPGVTMMPVPSDLAPCTINNCEGAHCTTNVGGTFSNIFAQCLDSSSCVPDGFIASQYQPEFKTCATFEGFEGRCLSTCLPEVSGQIGYLPQDSCDCTERCAPCYLPWPAPAGQSADTGVCTTGSGDMPKTALEANQFALCGNSRGVCVPSNVVPAAFASAAPPDTCPSGHVCAPISYVQTPNYQFPACRPSNALLINSKNAEGQAGACVPSYLVDDLVPTAKTFVKQDGCPNSDDLCGPCTNPYSQPAGQATGICPP
jgi:hypothetical protein